MSFVLTTRIWFNISIEGLFVMPQNNQTLQAGLDYDKENLLKPSKMVVHTEQIHTLIFNTDKDKEYYEFILYGAKDTMRDWLTNNESYTLSSVPKEQLQQIRENRAVEFIFDYNMEFANIKSLLDIEKNPWSDITDITSIIISPDKSKIYLVDKNKDSIYQFTSAQMPTVLTGVITEIEKRNDYSYVFLNMFNKQTVDYGDYAIVPVSIATMPSLKVKSEIEIGDRPDPKILDFFDGDSSNISSVKDIDGKITYTDREEENVTIDAQGALEYYKYNVTTNDTKSVGVKEAIDIATQYVTEHIEFTHDFYLSNVESTIQGGRTSYIISFDYKYGGVPIITELDTGSSAIEVEILGQEVKRYKRNVRMIEDQGKAINIKSFSDILDIVWGNLDTKLNTTKSESIVVLNDLYLAYIERNAALIPIWVVEVRVENNENKQYDRKFIIGAEEGEIGVILDEK
jgi:hypothetical protein